MIEYIEMTFTGGPQEVKRIIVRSAIDTAVDKLKEGKFTLFKGDETAEIDFKLDTESVCVLHIILANAIESIKAVAMETTKIRMDILDMHKDVKLRTGFKIDLFIKLEWHLDQTFTNRIDSIIKSQKNRDRSRPLSVNYDTAHYWLSASRWG